MADLNRIEVINEHDKYNKLIFRLGYLNVDFFRDVDIYSDFKEMKQNTNKYNYEIYNDLSVKYHLHSESIRRIVKKLSIIV